MVFERLHTFGSKAERVIMYPKDWRIGEADPSTEARLLLKAQNEYHVHLVPVHVQHLEGDATWADSFTKLLAFNQTQYDRVISLDSDGTLLQPMDELFSLPSAPVAMARAYWLDDDSLSSQLLVVEPSDFVFKRIQGAMRTRQETQFDMELVNDLYRKDCLILPHRPYTLLTGEFRSKDHSKYLGSKEEVWDSGKVFAEAKFVHFSDWPFPKPWFEGSEELRVELQPTCKNATETEPEDCTGREIWNNLYVDYRERHKERPESVLF
ncbi:hypothetical protein AAFC00_006641 [Neodothiora populina]|uniref:Nucleotide-diphospho-sugar transferase n=1 Tax=Neodothiora populina TaxID=2781224 RepID=A0ABR3PAN6_9PEZI